MKLLKFYSTNCPGCKVFQPVREQLKKTYPGLQPTEVNTDTEEGYMLAVRYDLRANPTVILIKDDKPIKYGGTMDFESIAQWIRDNL